MKHRKTDKKMQGYKDDFEDIYSKLTGRKKKTSMYELLREMKGDDQVEDLFGWLPRVA